MGSAMVKEFNINVKEEPTYGEFVDVLTLLGITEKQFRQDPEAALRKAKNLDSIDEYQELADLISVDKVNLRDESLSVAQHVVGIATSFFLTESYLCTMARKSTDADFTSQLASRDGSSRAARILGLISLLQHSNQLNTQKSEGGV
jgi:hypothetical protein